MWVDTHCHLQLAGADPVLLLDRATNVDWVVAPGIDLESSRAAIDLARADQRVLATAGLHPHDASEWSAQRDGLIALLPEVVAVGETGLDYYRNLSDPAAQRQSFADHLALATEHGLPVIVHTRDAFSDVYDHLAAAELGERAVLHCWTGGPRWTKRFLELGATFSFAGPVAFETGDTVRRGAALVPPERAMVETDTPYLTPPPHRGEPNEPAYVALNGAALAAVWGLSVEEVAVATSERAARLFRPGRNLRVKSDSSSTVAPALSQNSRKRSVFKPRIVLASAPSSSGTRVAMSLRSSIAICWLARKTCG